MTLLSVLLLFAPPVVCVTASLTGARAHFTCGLRLAACLLFVAQSKSFKVDFRCCVKKKWVNVREPDWCPLTPVPLAPIRCDIKSLINNRRPFHPKVKLRNMVLHKLVFVNHSWTLTSWLSMCVEFKLVRATRNHYDFFFYIPQLACMSKKQSRNLLPLIQKAIDSFPMLFKSLVFSLVEIRHCHCCRLFLQESRKST